MILPEWAFLGLRVFAVGLGVAIVGLTFFSAVETFVVPRSRNDPLTRLVFITIFRPFAWRVRRAENYEARDAIMAFFAPAALLALPPVWILLVMLGYMFIYWGIGYGGWTKSLELSGSSLLTLGFVGANTIPQHLLAFSEALLGLVLIALLIAYLPTIYGAFQRRELIVNMLEVRAGAPPTAWHMLERYHRIHGLDQLHDIWLTLEEWFADLEESHTSIGALTFFRSQQANRSWITAAGAVLDAAALARSTLDIQADPQADLCIRAGYLCLRRVCDFFGLPYNNNPKPDDLISVARQEFDVVCDELTSQGLRLKADREQAWRDFAGWRVNYDAPLVGLAGLTMAPYAPWSSDRSLMTRQKMPPAIQILNQPTQKVPS
jgi:hypothetical protein